jgi:putative aldouronate transport system permease protein
MAASDVAVADRPVVSSGDESERHKRAFMPRLSRDWLLVLLGVPGAIALILFQYVPLLGNVIAFQDYQPYLGITGSPWVGVQNFSIIVNGDPAFLGALKNTLILTVIQTVLVFPVPLVIALVLSSLAGERLKRSLQSILYLPHFLSWVIVVALFQQMLGNAGMLNTFLLQHGWPTFDVIGVPDLFKALLTSQVIWKDAGWGTIIFLAALTKIEAELYEAAVVDGAGSWRRMWHVTLPGIRSVIVLLLILRLGAALSVGFEQYYLQRGAVGPQAAEVLDTFVFFRGIQGGDWGFATAVGLVRGIVGTALIVGANLLAKRFGDEGIY